MLDETRPGLTTNGFGWKQEPDCVRACVRMACQYDPWSERSWLAPLQQFSASAGVGHDVPQLPTRSPYFTHWPWTELGKATKSRLVRVHVIALAVGGLAIRLLRLQDLPQPAYSITN